jgi:hypothetical protein
MFTGKVNIRKRLNLAGKNALAYFVKSEEEKSTVLLYVHQVLLGSRFQDE